MFFISVIAGAIGILFVVAVGLLWLWDAGLCGNDVMAIEHSPNGRWQAVLFERNCGATTGFSSQVSILRVGQALRNEAGNVYVAEGYPRNYRLEWLNDASLHVSGASGRRFKALTSYAGIAVSYSTTPGSGLGGKTGRADTD